MPAFDLISVFEDHDIDKGGYWEIAGDRGTMVKPDDEDQIACIGRNSESKFDISHEDLDALESDVIKWCENTLHQNRYASMSLSPEKMIT